MARPVPEGMVVGYEGVFREVYNDGQVARMRAWLMFQEL